MFSNSQGTANGNSFSTNNGGSTGGGCAGGKNWDVRDSCPALIWGWMRVMPR